jgi:thiamine-monophosphate kinase
MAKSERELVQWLRRYAVANPLRLPIGIGDDMAAVRVGAPSVLVTADMLMDGVDFRTAEHTPQQIGRKALACSLSDCAAMAVMPLAAVVSVALPNGWSMQQAQALYEGMSPLMERFHCPLAGGDTNSWNHPLVIDVAVLAQPFPRIAPVRRSGARAGDSLFVSGPLGGSLLGRHLSFEPRIGEARRLAETLGADLHAMLDISDGLAIDCARLCEASGVGAEIDAVALERGAIHADALAASQQDGRPPIDHALHDGEDFELLAACGRTDEAIETFGSRWTRIGRIVESGLWLLRPAGRKPLEPKGWEHFKE